MAEEPAPPSIESLQKQIGALRDENAELESAIGDLHRRLAAAERRHAATIEAISEEIRRMSVAVGRRLDALEARPIPPTPGKRDDASPR